MAKKPKNKSLKIVPVSFHDMLKGNRLTVADLRKEARRHGATVHNNSTPKQGDYGIEAPAGHVWQCAEVHELVVNWNRGDSQWKHAPIADAIARMGMGTMPCPAKDTPEGCEWCGSKE
jgi:hypothetical protein